MLKVHYGSMGNEKYYPSEENLGKDCLFWQGVDVGGNEPVRIAVGCHYPKQELIGRLSCEGLVDDVCLFIKSGRKPSSLTEDEIAEIRFRIPDFNKNDLPPGNIY